MTGKAASDLKGLHQTNEEQLRKSTQFLMPAELTEINKADGAYDIYPRCTLGNGKIFNGYESIAKWIVTQQTVLIDGYAGVFWEKVKAGIDNELTTQGLRVNWIETSSYFKTDQEINTMISPFLGPKDAVWGTKCTLSLSDLFEMEKVRREPVDLLCDINIVIGTGAALSPWEAALIYIDLPKNELQFRMRAGSITNLGCPRPQAPFLMYKRFYFADWVLLNQHKKEILNRTDIVADGQWPNEINWMFMDELKTGLSRLAESVIRVRPWFEPGAWGGQWIKRHIQGLNTEVVNYAWSFELIVPENGLLFESDGHLLEITFDFIMFCHNQKILGKHAQQFGDEFPVRFDFLDTVKGGNLSIQCHPSLEYIREEFGENITQDETYYILDCEEEAKVYLGFQENIDAPTFRSVLEDSQVQHKKIDIEEYVQAHAAKKHDLFLIPNGTVHSAGAGNLVLEISATPYIFTFKMYDWLRLDLDGKPRPINIDHAFKNLDFERKGSRVKHELIARPVVLEQGADWQLIHLPTHAEHFYDVHRIEFDTIIEINTADTCHILMLVEGHSLRIETADGTWQTFAYAETFVVPAAAKNYTLINLGKGRVKVIKAFLK